MKEILKKEKCTGCSACMSICPVNAISFVENNEGFKYPVIDQGKCIDCGVCKKKCPVLNNKSNKSLNICYAGYSKKKADRINSSSGGLFSIIANYVLDNNGVVVGAAFDDNNNLKHIAIDKKKKLDKLRKSKYIQSDLDNIFRYIKSIVSNRKVLFVGTPCQVAGIKAFVDSDNLITIDLFCHGVPSPKIFSKYIKELEEKYQDKVLDYDFRDNSTGWENYSSKAVFKNNEVKTPGTKNEYMKLFLSDIALRQSCYKCNFKIGNKYSDITLGDFWGVKNYHIDMYNQEGVSAVIINTDLGREVFKSIETEIIFKRCQLKEIVSGNPLLKKSVANNKKREFFFEEIDNRTFKYLTKKYTKKSLLSRIRKKIRIFLDK